MAQAPARYAQTSNSHTYADGLDKSYIRDRLQPALRQHIAQNGMPMYTSLAMPECPWTAERHSPRCIPSSRNTHQQWPGLFPQTHTNPHRLDQQRATSNPTAAGRLAEDHPLHRQSTLPSRPAEEQAAIANHQDHHAQGQFSFADIKIAIIMARHLAISCPIAASRTTTPV